MIRWSYGRTLEDYLEYEVVVAVAATTAVLSPRVRKALRCGAVYGLAGVLMAGDAVSAAARNAAPGVQQAAASAAETVQGAAQQSSRFGRKRGRGGCREGQGRDGGQ